MNKYNGVIGYNATDFGYSMQRILDIMIASGARWQLIRNSPKLVDACHANGIKTVFRYTTDDPSHDTLNQRPDEFVRQRAQMSPTADLIHLDNELDPSDDQRAWTRRALQELKEINRLGVIDNYATNKTLQQWLDGRDVIETALDQGCWIGAHWYVDGVHDDGGRAFLQAAEIIGGARRWMLTEFAWIKSIFDANDGHLGDISDDYYAAWLENYAREFAALGYPAMLFSLEDWPNDDQGRRDGFGTLSADKVQAGITYLNGVYQLQDVRIVKTPRPVGLADAPIETVTRYDLRLRGAPSLSANTIRIIPRGMPVKVFPLPVVTADGLAWCFAQDESGNEGYSAIYLPSGSASFNPPVPLPATVDAVTRKLYAPAGNVNLRRSMTTDADNIVARVPNGATVEVAIPPQETPVNGYVWAAVKWQGASGYMARLKGLTWLQQFQPVDPVPEPEPETFTEIALNCYVSQTDQNADLSQNDCWIASMLIATRCWTEQRTGIVPDLPTVDDITPYTPVANPAVKGMTFSAAKAIARRLGFAFEYIQPLTEAKIEALINAGIVVIPLLRYDRFNPADAFNGNHYAALIGYSKSYFKFHDPYHGGREYVIPRAQAMSAMRDIPGEAFDCEALALAVNQK